MQPPSRESARAREWHPDAAPRAAELLGKLRAWQTATNAPRVVKPNPAYDPKTTPDRGREGRKGGKGGKNSK